MYSFALGAASDQANLEAEYIFHKKKGHDWIFTEGFELFKYHSTAKPTAERCQCKMKATPLPRLVLTG